MNDRYSKNESDENTNQKRSDTTDLSSRPHAGLLGADGKPIPETNPDDGKAASTKIADAASSISKWVVIWAGVTALATIFQGGIAWYSNHSSGRTQTDQFNQMKSVSDRMEGAAKSFAGNSANINQGIAAATSKLQAQAQAIEAARKTSEKNSKKALDATINNSRRDQRSWVGLDGTIQIDYLQTVPSLIVMSHYSVKNFGGGPALKVVSAAWFETDGATLKYAAIGACSSAQSVTTGKTVRPTMSLLPRIGRIGYTLFPQQPHIETIGAPGDAWQGDGMPNLKHFWFLGCIAYLDQFEAVHWTRFCVESDYKPHPMDKDIPLKFCALYNDTDEEDEKAKTETHQP